MEGERGRPKGDGVGHLLGELLLLGDDLVGEATPTGRGISGRMTWGADDRGFGGGG